MSRGGARPGAGRPKGSKNGAVQSETIRAEARAAGMTPLEYMLAVMNDANADEARRDRMAQAAAPYVHARAEASEGGKKARREQAAQTAEVGTDWESLLSGAPN